MLNNRNQRQQSGPPTTPPPTFIPNEAQATQIGGPMQQSFGAGGPGGPQAFAVDPGAIFPCVFRFTYIWPNRGNGFWAFPVFVGRNSIAGWRFNGRRWVYFGMDLRRIRSFYC